MINKINRKSSKLQHSGATIAVAQSSDRQHHKTRNVFLFSLVFFALSISGCKKLVQVDPPVTSINGQSIFTDDVTAAAVFTGIYTHESAPAINGSIGTPNSGGLTNIGLVTGLSSDELSLYNLNATSSPIAAYGNLVNASGFEKITDFWSTCYNKIYIINQALEGMSASNTLTPAVNKQLTGEAKFLRAFYYFYLVNLYGDVPLVLTTDYKVNQKLSRAPKVQIWAQIIKDLKEAQLLLSPDFLDAKMINKTTERVRPTKWAATALLARAYLYTRDFINAEAQATSIINNTATFQLNALSAVFSKNSTESIWQFQPVNANWNTEEAKVYIIDSRYGYIIYNIYISNQLVNTFEANDQRLKNWLNKATINKKDYYYAYKYKSATYGNPVTEYYTILRLAEQYLIRAEARLQQNNMPGALADLNIIRRRAGLPDANANTTATLLTAILHERQVELFTEWGHRWLDLKRTQTVDAVMSITTPLKGGTWNTNAQLYPIPINDILLDNNITQNPGY